ncbi:MAG: GDSL-type esterase/lipase family protein [Parvibaculum sp.]
MSAAPLDASECAAPPGLERFHAAIAGIEEGKRSRPLTVLHLGDSHISLDTFTRGLRKRWHRAFGNAGRGLMPGVPFRYYTPDGFDVGMTGPWQIFSSLPADATGPFGIQGFRVSGSAPDAVITLTGDKPFSRITLDMYGGPDTGAVLLALDDAAALKLQTRLPEPGFLRLSVPAAASRAVLRPAGTGPVHLLGWAAETAAGGRPGVRYDSYGVVAARASITAGWDAATVRAQIAAMKPDLVILGYGTNEGFRNVLDTDEYRRLLEGFTGLIKTAAPEASLAFLGPFDGARRGTGEPCGGGWSTPPKLAAVRDVLRELARSEKAFFWDGAAAMGGRCSADEWARREPPFMYADRVHLRRQGADRLSEALWGELMTNPDTEAGCAAGAPAGP